MDNVIPLFEGATETRKIKRSALKNWLVRSLSICSYNWSMGNQALFSYLPCLDLFKTRDSASASTFVID